jgi:hypothetical protein
MAAASHSSRHSKPTASSSAVTASNSSRSQSQDNKSQTVSYNPPLSASTVTSLPTSSTDGQVTSSSNTQRQQPLNGSATTTSFPGSPKSAGLFAFAAAALSSVSEPRLRPRQSLNRLSLGPDSALGAGRRSLERPSPHRLTLSNFSSSSTLLGEGKFAGSNPPSKPYWETDPNRPLPIHISRPENKMHQTSSRLLRMTDDDRPFTKVRTGANLEVGLTRFCRAVWN